MQATVHRFDPDTLAGSVLRDDGVALSFAAEVFAASGLRLLRVGQRVTIEADADGVNELRIIGVGLDQPIR